MPYMGSNDGLLLPIGILQHSAPSHRASAPNAAEPIYQQGPDDWQ